jgi:hypothetical protein
MGKKRIRAAWRTTKRWPSLRMLRSPQKLNLVAGLIRGKKARQGAGRAHLLQAHRRST